MSISMYRVLPLLSFFALFLNGSPSATAQGCPTQLRKMDPRASSPSVSVAELRVPEKAWDHFEKARHATDLGNQELFDRETDLALKVYPGFAQIYLLRAIAQVQSQQYEKAIGNVAQARSLQPGIRWSGIVLASALTGLHRYGEAIAETDRVGSPDAYTWQWAFERTRAEVGRGDASGALRFSKLTLAIAPASCAEVHLLRANAFQIAGRRADVIAELQTYLTFPGTPESTRLHAQRIIENTRKRMEAESGELVAAN